MVRLPDPEESRDRRRQAGRYVGRRDVLLYALVPERRRVDDPAEARDRLWQLQTELAHPGIRKTFSVVRARRKRANVRRLREWDAQKLRHAPVARPDDGRVLELHRDLLRRCPCDGHRTDEELEEF